MAVGRLARIYHPAAASIPAFAACSPKRSLVGLRLNIGVPPRGSITERYHFYPAVAAPASWRPSFYRAEGRYGLTKNEGRGARGRDARNTRTRPLTFAAICIGLGMILGDKIWAQCVARFFFVPPLAQLISARLYCARQFFALGQRLMVADLVLPIAHAA